MDTEPSALSILIGMFSYGNQLQDSNQNCSTHIISISFYKSMKIKESVLFSKFIKGSERKSVQFLKALSII